MTIQFEEIQKLEKKVKQLEDIKSRSNTNHSVELQRAQTQIENWKKSANENAIGTPLAQVKQIIWDNIINEMKEIWPYIQIMFEQKELGEKANTAISEIKDQLGTMPATTNRIIIFLNSKDKYQLEELGVEDRTKTILEVKKVLTKKNLVTQLEEKCHTLEFGINMFLSRIDALIKKDCLLFLC